MSNRIEKFSQLFSLKEKQDFVNDPSSLIPNMEELQFENSDVSIMTTIIEKYPNRIISMLSDPYSEETNDLVKIVSNETGVNDELLSSLFNDLTQAAMIGGIVQKDGDNDIVVQTCGPLKKIGSGTVQYYGQVRSVTLYESGEEELFVTDAHGKEEDIKGCDSLSCTFSYDDGTGYSGRIRITDIRQISDNSIDHSFGCVYRYHGKGRLTWANKDVYEGDFIDDGRTGRGRYVWANGDIYEGDFVDDGRTGKGRFTWANGDVYEGDFIGDVMNGKGRMTWKDGSFYEGDFTDGEQTGKGMYVWANGDVYNGDFLNNRRTGNGRFVWANKDVYEGNFVDNKRTGKGRFTGADGTVYEGDFVDNRFNGKGRMTWKDGSFYEGEWKNNERNGDGIQHEPRSFLKKKNVRYKNGMRQ